MDWKRVNNDIYGNPRYVCHFSVLSTPADDELGTMDRYAAAAARAAAQARVDLLTPVAKGWCTETGIELASVGVQIPFSNKTRNAPLFHSSRLSSTANETTVRGAFFLQPYFSKNISTSTIRPMIYGWIVSLISALLVQL